MNTTSLLYRIGREKGLETLLRDFYGRARKDELIGPLFERKVDHWEAHMEKVVIYWRRQTEGPPNYRQTFHMRHRPLSLKRKHFDRWLSLFREACDRNLETTVADEVFDIALRVAGNLYREVVNQETVEFAIGTESTPREQP